MGSVGGLPVTGTDFTTCPQCVQFGFKSPLKTFYCWTSYDLVHWSAKPLEQHCPCVDPLNHQLFTDKDVLSFSGQPIDVPAIGLWHMD